MDIAVVRPLLARLGLDADTVRPITGGWASWTFDAADPGGDPWIVRIARTEQTAASYQREERLLPRLAEALSFTVPVPAYNGDWNGQRYMAYRKLPGRPLRRGDRHRAVASMLRELHDFPVDAAAGLVGGAASVAAWREEYERLRDHFERVALGRLDAGLRRAVRREYDRFLGAPMDFTPALVHRDLGTGHILVDPATGTPTGLIDFETAAVGDPAIDFVGLLITLGPESTDEVLGAYGRPIDRGRLRFYWWMGSLHALDYGIETGDDDIVRDAIHGLRERLSHIGSASDH